MSRFAGCKNNKLYIISDQHFTHPEYEIIEVPDYLYSVSNFDLITDYKVRNSTIVKKKQSKPASELKIAFVGNWKMRCGISTYSENLLPHIAKQVKDIKLFIEENDEVTGPLNHLDDLILENEKVFTCWKRGGSNKSLIAGIKEYDPDIVWIQHEFGLWSNARYWLAMMNQLSEFRVIVTMHSVFHHQDKTIVEAAMPEVIVHLDGAKKLLKEEKGIPGKVHVIPHGCYHSKDNTRLWNFYKSDRTFMQFGYLFKYKSWENSLYTTALLKEKYPDVFFTGLCSESPFAHAEHEVYYNELMELAKKLDIEENIALIRGYQSDQSLDSFLRTNQVAVFPYISHPEHEVFGASGAARLAMSKGIPVITSSVNHFSDLCTIKADTPQEIANELEKLFGNWSAIKHQVDLQSHYIEENSWEKVAQRHLHIFENNDLTT